MQLTRAIANKDTQKLVDAGPEIFRYCESINPEATHHDQTLELHRSVIRFANPV